MPYRELNVMHVEDETLYHQAVKPLFTDLGFEYLPVTDSEEALKTLHNEAIDLIVLDCFLRSSGINGDALAELLVKESSGLPIIFCSSSRRPIMIHKLKMDFPQATITECPKDIFLTTLKEYATAPDRKLRDPMAFFKYLDAHFCQTNPL